MSTHLTSAIKELNQSKADPHTIKAIKIIIDAIEDLSGSLDETHRIAHKAKKNRE